MELSGVLLLVGGKTYILFVIELENYELSQDDVETIIAEADQKFGNCQQYRLFALASRPYSCFTCISRPTVVWSIKPFYDALLAGESPQERDQVWALLTTHFGVE